MQGLCWNDIVEVVCACLLRCRSMIQLNVQAPVGRLCQYWIDGCGDYDYLLITVGNNIT